MSWLLSLPNFQNASKTTLIVLSMYNYLTLIICLDHTSQPPCVFKNLFGNMRRKRWCQLWIRSKCLCLDAGTLLTTTQAQKRYVFITGGVGLYFITNKLLCLPPPKVVSLQLRRKCHEINRNTVNVIIIYCIYKMYFKSLEWTRFHTIICRYCR